MSSARTVHYLDGRTSVNGVKSSGYKRCYETHPPLKLVEDIVVYGGSCSNPVVKDAEVYVGLDLSHRRVKMSYPWEVGESFLYYIQDMRAPEDTDSYLKLIEWLSVQLTARKKVHVGCIGGHGRTGTVLSSLVYVMSGEVDAITYVRDNYCKKAVESEEQIKFLSNMFGIKKVTGSKSFSSVPKYGGTSHGLQTFSKPVNLSNKKKPHSPATKKVSSIWSTSVLFDKPR